MSEYVAVTGKLGSGKGLCSIGRMLDYLNRGKPVLTNMDIFPEEFKDKYNDKVRIYRVPDHPSSDDIKICGLGNDTKDPEENGVAILDELATWFNAHNWNSKEAKQLNDLLVHLRKLGWDGLFQVQSIESMNSQARRNIITSEARCSKVRKIHIPIISGIIRNVTGKPWKLPRSMMFHSMIMRNLETGILEEKLRYRGSDLFKYYNTSQIFDEHYPHGTFCYLTPWHLVGRYEPKKPLITFTQALNFVCYPIRLLLTLVNIGLGIDSVKSGVFKPKNISQNPT